MAKPFTIALSNERLAVISAKVAAFDCGHCRARQADNPALGSRTSRSSSTNGARGSNGARRHRYGGQPCWRRRLNPEEVRRMADVLRYEEDRPDLWHVFDEDMLLTNIML